ncbi:MAG: hypothetical protein NPIRA02_15240 [Nitrospirales bacterium]|nr:MAG: hypothetical protein NPIRA02_15240 [Nitrospirales bacterium]
MISPAFGQAQVGLYDKWETSITNSKKYSNPFDYNVIELRATFTSPSGAKTNFFGFYDGNGRGGQDGNVWKLRFMPNKVGTWTYSYSWTDGTSGGSGNFRVVDSGLSGPLVIDNNGTNSWYFKDSRGKPFHFRGYDLHHIDTYSPNDNPYTRDISWFKNVINKEMVNKGYNFTMLDLPTDRVHTYRSNNADTLWVNETDVKKFNIRAWRGVEDILNHMKSRNIYAITFAGMIFHGNGRPGGVYNFNDFKVFMRYYVARLGAYSNFFGWSPVWEWTDVWSDSQVNQIMNQIQSWDPFKRLLTIHDCADNNFSGWLDFSMRQAARKSGSGFVSLNSVFSANSRTAGAQQNGVGRCDASGGVASRFLGKPIIGSEDIWENSRGVFGQPKNSREVRRTAWGVQMAGVMPLYSEWNPWSGGKGTGKEGVRRMFDFFYSKTQYRQYKQLNNLVSKSARQIASGKEGLEYLVYDENGGAITINLSGAGGSNTFDVLWFNPTTGATQNGGTVKGGASRTLQSPISGDTVLLLTRGEADTTPPAAPRGLRLN